MSETFGQVIRKARREEEYSQRELAKLIGVDYTYLSKLENDHAGYPPSQQVIESLATHLKLNAQTLGELAGRISSKIPTNADFIASHERQSQFCQKNYFRGDKIR